MAKFDHPLFGKLGAFWMEGRQEPFYSLKDALDLQYNKGGAIFDFKGKLLYPDPEPGCPTCSQCQTRIHLTEATHGAIICPACGSHEGTIQSPESSEISANLPVATKGSFWSRIFKSA